MKEYENAKKVHRTTVKEARREAFAMMVGFWIGAIICAVLYLVIKSDWRYLPMVLGIFWFICSFVNYFKTLAKINRSSCPCCSIVYDFEEDVGYKSLNTQYEPGDTRAYLEVEFTCYCPCCGHQETFRHSFVLASYNKDINRWEYNDSKMKDIIKDYFYN